MKGARSLVWYYIHHKKKDMKANGSIIINAPRDKVAQYFGDPQYLDQYQDTFLRKVQISGNPGQNNAIAKMYYTQGKDEMELTETITNNNLPESFEAFYHHKHMDNTMKVTLTAISRNETQYDTEIEYTRVDWIMPRIFMTLLWGKFKKISELWTLNFKAFVEKQ